MIQSARSLFHRSSPLFWGLALAALAPACLTIPKATLTAPMTEAQCRAFATARTVCFELTGDWENSERWQLSSIWQKAGFAIVPDREQADLIVQVTNKEHYSKRVRHGFTQYNKPATATEVTVRKSGFIVLTRGQTVYRRDFASVTHNPDFWDSFTNLGPYTTTGESQFKVMASLAESIRRAR